jgi:PAS domain S-box-containing protein
MQNDLRVAVKDNNSGTHNLLQSRQAPLNPLVLEDRGRLFALGASISVIVIGGLVLFGWVLDSSALTTIVYEGIPMKPLTAICFVIGGIGLMAYDLIAPEDLSGGWKLRLSQGCGGFIALVGGFTSFEYLSGFDSGIHEVLFRQQVFSSNAIHPGRMALATAGSFLFLGLALMLLNSTSRPINTLTQFLALIVFGLGLMAFQGYMFEVKHLYQFTAYSAVAIHTAVGLILFALGILFVQIRRGWMAVVSSVHLGGLLVRNLLPLVITLPLIFAWIRWKGEKAGWYDTGFGLALFTTTNMIVLGLVIWRNGHQLNALDQMRCDAEEKNHQIINSLPQLIWTCEPGGQCDFLSQQWVDYTGLAAEAQFGTGWLTCVHPDDRDNLMTLWDASVANGSDFHTEFRIRRSDQMYRWFDTRAIPWRNAEGQIIKWFGSNTDIHEQYEMRQHLLSNESRMSGIINSAMDAIITVDENQHIQIFNAAAEKMFGYSPSEVLGRSIDFLIPGRFRKIHSTHIRNFGETNVTRRTMGELNAIYGLRASGEEFPIEASISQIGDTGGKLFTVILRDITERKKAEDALQESEARFRLMADCAPVLIWVSGIDKLCTYFNKGWLDFTGRTMEQEMGNGWAEGVHADDLTHCLEIYQTAFDAREPFAMEYRLRHHDGTYHWLLDIGTPRFSQSSTFIGYIGSCIDISERKDAEQALKENEERYRSLVVATSQLVWRADAEGKAIGTTNWETITGFEQDARGRTWFDLVHPDDRESVQAEWQKALREVTVFESEHRLLHADGTYHNFVSRGVPVFQDHTVREWIGTVTDITERKRAEAALFESEALFSTIFRVSPISISISNLSTGQYITVNDAFLNRYGLTSEEVIGHTSEELGLWISSADRRRFRNQLQVEGKAHNFETQYRTKAGEVGDVLVSAEIIEQTGEKYLLSIGYDISERKRAEAVVSRNRAQLEAVFQAIQDGIVVTDMEGNFLLVNDAESRITGFPSTQMMQENLSYFREIFELRYPNGQVLPFADWPLNKILHGQSIKHWELLVKRLDIGREWYFSYNGEPVYNEHGEQILCVVSTSDITERKLAEKEIHRLNAELEERVLQRTRQLEAANKELEAFSYSVSHDLRSPLRTIDGFSQAVLEDFGPQLPAEGQRYLNVIRDGAQRMGNLIDDLLTFSRLSRQALNKKPVNTAQLVREVLKELQAEQQNRDIDLKVGELLTCQGDAVLLKQVWINLISNALKYSRGQHPATIEIGCTLAGDEKVYFVRDNGTGFDMQYAHKLFGVFQRLHRAEDFEGTGVGLAIVQRVINRHGGRVWAEAAVGKGATFYFTVEGESLS